MAEQNAKDKMGKQSRIEECCGSKKFFGESWSGPAANDPLRLCRVRAGQFVNPRLGNLSPWKLRTEVRGNITGALKWLQEVKFVFPVAANDLMKKPKTHQVGDASKPKRND
ncbi:hypothetical protein Acr_00g0048970 [Actinidia rufa]|uniref:Uncharacterized protein n=1 Tax=Actinidia rufa TaxID=165716 RepID=A0A7J0DKC1_9ERIC|nr:hypothetical protein Acr_00g0048970 [Actinidia rufa]